MGNIYEVKNTGEVKLKSFTSDPAGIEGEVIYNTTDKKLKYYDGTQWVSAGAGTGTSQLLGGNAGIHLQENSISTVTLEGPTFLKKGSAIVNMIDISGSTFITSNAFTWSMNIKSQNNFFGNTTYFFYDSQIGRNMVINKPSNDTIDMDLRPQAWIYGETLYDYENTPTQITIRELDSSTNNGLTNPTGFNTFGTEYTSTKYTNVQNPLSSSTGFNLNSSGNTYKHLAVRFTSVTTSDIIIPLLGFSFQESGISASNTISIEIWNNNTSSWDILHSPSSTSTAVTAVFDNNGGAPLGFPISDKLVYSDYTKRNKSYYINGSNEVYLRMSFNNSTSTNTTYNIGYIGLASGFLDQSKETNVTQRMYVIDQVSSEAYKHYGISTLISSFFDSGLTSPNAVTFDGTNLISGYSNPSIINIHSGFSSTINSSFTINENANDIYYDGTNLITCDNLNIKERNGLTSAVNNIYYSNFLNNVSSSSFRVTGAFAKAITFDNSGNMIIAESDGNTYVHSGTSTTITSSFVSPDTLITGLTFDGINLISCGNSNDKIYIHSGITGTITTSFASPSVVPSGVAFDGTNLISCDLNTKKVYLHSGITSTISNSFTVTHNINGVEWDGKNLITIDDNATGTAYLHSGFSSTVLATKTYTTNTHFNDLAILPNNGFLYIVTDDDNSLLKLRSFILSVTSDGTNLITLAGSSKKIYKHSGHSSTILSSFSVTSIYAISYDTINNNLISIQTSNKQINIHSGVTSTITETFSINNGLTSFEVE